MRLPSLIAIASLAVASRGEGTTECITSINDFIGFTNAVNGGTPYDGTTVFLTTDIDLFGMNMVPIGEYGTSGGFLGTFDGLGHTISNMIIDSDRQTVGLFGNSESSDDESVGGTTIRNLVIGRGSSITSSYSSYDACVGGILAYSSSRNHPTIVENCVNMATIKYTGAYKSRIGGIIGSFLTEDNPTIVRNCANYGDISSNGPTSYIGGIVGYGENPSYKTKIINNINYGSIYSRQESPESLVIGGIVGVTNSFDVFYCVNLGQITMFDGQVIGPVIGGALGNVGNAFDNYYSDKVGCIQQSRKIYMFYEDNLTLATDGSSLVDNLNYLVQSYSQQLSSWAINKGGNEVAFKLNGDSYLTLNSSVILLPTPINNNAYFFDGWYFDESRETLFVGNTITSPATLYGAFFNASGMDFVVTLISLGTVYTTIRMPYGEYVSLPMNITKEGDYFIGWAYEDGTYAPQQFQVPGRNTMLFAKWRSIIINTQDQFVEFVDDVASGVTYEGLTVFLDNDIDMSGVTALKPIGENFVGTFNGKGHVIRNLIIDSNSYCLGLFNRSYKSSIVNVILDDSCSFTSRYFNNEGSSIVGGIAGVLSGYDGSINVKNCVTMATIAFMGNAKELQMGGIVGQVSAYDPYSVEIRNCAYLGNFTAKDGKTVAFGGIAGLSVYTSIANCLFGGYFGYEGKGSLYVGGILGYSHSSSTHTYISNCVVIKNFQSNGWFSYSPIICNKYYAGTNYWHDPLGLGSYDGYEFDGNLKTVENLDLGYYSGNSLIDALNSYCNQDISYGLSQWIGNPENKSVKFLINGNEAMNTTSFVVLTPSLAVDTKYWFDGWYRDKENSVLFNESEVHDSTELYANYSLNTNTYSVTFIFDGETKRVIEAKYGSVIELPVNLTKDRYKFWRWVDEDGRKYSQNFTIFARNITLYPQWLITGIVSVDDFKEFRKVVNTSERPYSSLTVTLENDLEFPEGDTQEPIGTHYPFNGTFDGKGHLIRNIKVSTNYSESSGLFASIEEGSIRNVVLDGTSVFEFADQVPSSGDIVLGSILGYAYSYGEVIIEDCLNMGTIRHTNGKREQSISIGGIVGVINELESPVSVRRCSNFGIIVLAGRTADNVIGGIVGYFKARYIDSTISNCLNNGEIHDTSISSMRGVGGIVGYADGGVVEFSVSYGKIYAGNDGVTSVVQPIAPYVDGSQFNHTFYFDYASLEDQTNSLKFSEDFMCNGENVVDILNRLNGGSADWSLVTFNIPYGKLFEPVNSTSQRRRSNSGGSGDPNERTYLLIKNFMPPITADEKPFIGWFKDAKITQKVNRLDELETVATLYAGFTNKAVFRNDKKIISTTALDAGSVIDVPFEETKTCHEFRGWEAREGAPLPLDDKGNKLMPNRDVDIEAIWEFIKYDVSFFETDTSVTALNGTEAACGSNLNLTSYIPSENPGFAFMGWSLEVGCNKIEEEIVNASSAMTLYVCWKKENKGTNAGVIVGPIVGVLVLAIVAAVLIYLFLLKGKRDEENDKEADYFDNRYLDVELSGEAGVDGTYSRVVLQVPDDGIDNFVSTVNIWSLNSQEMVYPEYYRIPTIEEALKEAGLKEDQAKEITGVCMSRARKINDLPEELTVEDAAALALYTFDYGSKGYESNPFRLLNKNLIGRNTEGLLRIRGLLYLVMTAMRKLPRYTGKTLYRGVRQGAKINQGNYIEGKIVTWSAFSSTSPDLGTTKAFLAKNSSDGKASGTLFVIENAWGYDLKKFSLFPNEDEILLEPERQFKVKSVLKAELNLITLEMVKSPLLLPQVFGEPRDTGVPSVN